MIRGNEVSVLKDMVEYEVVEGWDKLPIGWVYTQVAGVSVDARDRVYVLNRGEHPIIVYEKDGSFVRSWGEGMFKNAHGAYIDEKDHIYCVDRDRHILWKFTTDGELLMTIGNVDVEADGEPFNLPTDVALAPDGDIYVSDGYGNNRVHLFSPEGKLLLSWGEKGEGPGQFNLPHGIWVRDGKVYVADRQNHRIQIFTLDGEYIDEWGGFKQPCDLSIDEAGIVYVPELQGRVSILNLDGEVLTRIGGERGHGPGEFYAPHCTWTDSEGSLYVGEVLEGQRIQKFVRK
jgi:DNA-binding beta-propeller fold protein YncE